MNADDAAGWDSLWVLFDELGELDESARAARLAELRAQSPLRARKLEELLAADATASGVLERSLDGVAPDLHRSLREGGWETRAGLVLGSYRLVEPIGSGGMGEVWRAERADGEYDQDVAIKLLKRGMDTQAILRRFLQERSILARLRHPGIVRLLDGGMGSDGRPYFVMEHVAGTLVTEHARMARLDVRARVAMTAKIADAIGYAHAQLVVHRDLKPSNVIVDADGEPHLLDFGIAKLLEDSSEQTETGSGMRMLSPAYAAPEQILGEPVCTATDVYALGLLLHELLTGQLPHRRASRNPDVLAAGLEHESLERTSDAMADAERVRELYGDQADAQRLAREVGGDLDLILAMAMRREPQRRHATAAAFANDLRSWLDGRPIAARADSARYRLGKFVRRHRLGVLAAAAILFALLGGLGIALWQAGVAREAAARADAERDLARQQAERAERVKEFVLALFREQDPASRARAQARTAPELIREGIAEVDARLAGDPALKAELLRDLGEIQTSLGDSAAGRATLERAWNQQVSLTGGDSVAALQAQAVHAAAGVFSGDPRAEPQLRDAVARLATALGPDHPQVTKGEIALARIAVVDARYDEALAFAGHALEVAVRVHGEGHPETASPLYLKGVIEGSMGRYEEALGTLGEGLAIIERHFGADHVRTITFRSQLGDLLRYLRRFGEGLGQLDQALAIARTQLPARHPMTGSLLGRIGDMQRRMDLFEAAEATFTEGAAVLAPAGGAPYAQLMQTHAMLASATGRHDLAIERLRIAVDEFRKSTGESAHTVLVELALVDAISTSGRLDAADRLLGSAAEKVSATLASDAYAVGYHDAVSGRLRYLQGRYAEALPLQRKSVAFLVDLYGEQHLDVAEARLLLARTLWAEGGAERIDEVARLLAQAQPVLQEADTKPLLRAEAHMLQAAMALETGDRARARSETAAAEQAAARDRSDPVALGKRVAALRRRVGAG